MQKAIQELTELENLLSGDIEVNLNKAEAISDTLFMDLFPNTHPNIEDFRLNFSHYATLAAILGDYLMAIRKALPLIETQAEGLKSYLKARGKALELINCANS